MFPEAVARRCSAKKLFFKFLKIRRKTPVSESFKKSCRLKLLAQVFMNLKKKIKNTFFTEHLRWLLLFFSLLLCNSMNWFVDYRNIGITQFNSQNVSQEIAVYINPFPADLPILYPLKTS